MPLNFEPNSQTPHSSALLGVIRPRPANHWELFKVFSLMSLQGFGGVLAVVQRELVDKHGWLTMEEFVEMWAVAQIMPGPNILNLAIIMGGEYFGPAGALTASLALFLGPTFVVLFLAAWFTQVQDLKVAQDALRGLVAVVSGLILATAMRMTPALNNHPLGKGWSLVLSGLTFTLITALKLPLVVVILGLGGLSCSLVAWRLYRAARA